MKSRIAEITVDSARTTLAKSLPAPETFFPYFQPLVYLPTGGIAGYELLARTRDAQGRVVSAGALFSDDTMPIDYQIGVDRHLRKLGFERFSTSGESGFLSINISPHWISRLGRDVSSPTLRLIEDAQVDPARIVIEITEASGDMQRMQQIVKQYHAAGLRVAIDDFGAGYSQLDRVIALHPDMIKLDMRLFKLAAKGGLSADVLLGMTTIAERSGCEVVCEGVETEDEFFFGVECGAQYMQGYLFSPALGDTMQVNTFQSRIRLLTEHYLQRKSQRLSSSVDHSAILKKLIFALQYEINESNTEGQLTPALLQEMQASGVMRFFVCDLSGNQTSPNYEIADGCVIPEHKYCGYNWSWRPYFPTLMAMRDRVGFNMVASTIYRDVNTGRLCKTFGLFLQDRQVLLVDAAVRDEVLYAGGR